MPADPVSIGCLWIGESLSFLEQLCLSSMVRSGAKVTLYAYQDVTGVPPGVGLGDAGDILKQDGALVHRKTGSPSIMADRFRYHLLRARPGTIWADADILFLKPLDPEGPHVFGYEGPRRINNALIGLPPGDPTLQALLDFSADPYPVPPWASADVQEKMRAERVHVADQPWGTWGPIALTHFLRETGAIAHAAAQPVYHPVAFRDVRDLIIRGRDMDQWIGPETRTIHLYGRAVRRIVAERFDGVPPWHGYLGRALKEYGIDPAAAPL